MQKDGSYCKELCALSEEERSRTTEQNRGASKNTIERRHALGWVGAISNRKHPTRLVRAAPASAQDSTPPPYSTHLLERFSPLFHRPIISHSAAMAAAGGEGCAAGAAGSLHSGPDRGSQAAVAPRSRSRLARR